MTLELIKCPHCGYKFRTDLEEYTKNGETIVTKGIFSKDEKTSTQNYANSFSITLKCPNSKCGKVFNWEIKI
jgi:uncharacterized C2H2 Zn-finger protein